MKNTLGNNSTTLQRYTVPVNYSRARANKKFHNGMHTGILMPLVVCIISVITAALAGQMSEATARTPTIQAGVSVAVLPFEVFSFEKEPTLGAEVASSIARQLALNPSITCVDSQKVQTVLQPDDYVAINEDRLRQIAKILNANFIISGTVTKIRSEHSIDVEMFSGVSGGPHFKTFAEGLEIKSLVETIVTALDQEIMRKADSIPGVERPKINAERKSSKTAPPGGFDVERELLEAFGPLEEESRTPTAPQKDAAGEFKNSTVPEAQKIDTSITPVDMPAAVKPDTPAANAPDETPAAPLQERKRSSGKGITDPGFFSLSKAISINSDTMEYDNRANMAIFKGNVVARQDDITMFANSMQVFYSESGGLSRVEATGDVRVIQGDRIATGSNIVFDNATQTIVATGNPRVWQGDNVVHGRKITVYLREERTVVDSEPNSRASATIYPDSDNKKP